MNNIYDSLVKYQESDMYPFHMPGHKRRSEYFINPYQIDITEIHGFDNLHHPEGIIKNAQDRAAALYGSEETHFLVNGSTGGILSAISACTTLNGKILMARNCHKAAYNAVMLRNLETAYLYPEREDSFGINGGIMPENVKKALDENADIQAVMITSPTYDGVVSDVGKIAEIVHERGIPLIVDEAHGAHFGFHKYFPESSVKLGADIVIHSLHKTLPCFTQTALLHVNSGRVNREMLRTYLGIYQSSSPSYIFMAGMDRCIQLIRENGEELFALLEGRLEKFYRRAEGFSKICLPGYGITGHSGISDFDRSKLVISVKDTKADGKFLYDTLREKYHLELEMAAGTYALALTTISDTDEGFDRLAQALGTIDKALVKSTDKYSEAIDTVTKNEIVYRIGEAIKKPLESVLLEQAKGRVCGEFVYIYPPGIPVLAPGERISGIIMETIKWLRHKGYSIQGTADYTARHICVID